MTETIKGERDLKRMHLSLNDVKVVFAVYLVLSAAGLFVVSEGIISASDGNLMEKHAIFYSGAMSLVGTGVYYIRKLYQALINDTYTFLDSASDQRGLAVRGKRIGTLAFFIFRPFFGVAFSIITYALWRLSISASGADTIKISAGFLYTTISLGFLSGFLAGRLLTMLEGYGSRRFGGILGGGN